MLGKARLSVLPILAGLVFMSGCGRTLSILEEAQTLDPVSDPSLSPIPNPPPIVQPGPDPAGIWGDTVQAEGVYIDPYPQQPLLWPNYPPSAGNLPSPTDAASLGPYYGWYNQFAKAHFGAEKEPLVYWKFGNTLTFIPSGAWSHVSRNSAIICFETNLPAQSWVEYGLTASYGERTQKHERHYYLHTHSIRGLENNQTIYYRLAAEDERGNVIYGPGQTLTTHTPVGAILLNGGSGSHRNLDQPNTTYILTENVLANGTAFRFIQDNITLDLNGHTILHSNIAGDTNFGIQNYGRWDNASGTQILASGMRVFNGVVVQGQGLGRGAYPRHENAEVAGLSVIYHSKDGRGLLVRGTGNSSVHHNTIIDMGYDLSTRHASFAAIEIEEAGRHTNVHHNLIKRTRKDGIAFGVNIHDNEIHLDSWYTNSWGIQPFSKINEVAGEHLRNKILGTGFNPHGFGWGHEDLAIKDNLIHFEHYDFRSRFHERGGGYNNVAVGVRLTNYDPGGQVRKNLRYQDNLIVVNQNNEYTIGPSQPDVRGMQLYTDYSISNTRVVGNVFKTLSRKKSQGRGACISAHGSYSKYAAGASTALPAVYEDNTFISNIGNIRFGDEYSQGVHHHFYRSRLVKVGDHPMYRTFRFDGVYTSRGHKVIDPTFEGGAAWDLVHNGNSGNDSYFSLQWTITINGTPEKDVRAIRADQQVEYSAKLPASGQVPVILSQVKVQPAGRPNVAGAKVTNLTPHIVEVEGRSVVVTADSAKSITVR